MKKVLLNQFFLDKEKDISISIYRKNEDELTYIIETPNHKTGNLITNVNCKWKMVQLIIKIFRWHNNLNNLLTDINKNFL